MSSARWRRLLLAGAFTTLFALAGLPLAFPAAAHTVLVGSSPTAGYSVAGPVRQVTLSFDEPVGIGPDAVQISGPTLGLRSHPELSDHDRTLAVATGLLNAGTYRVSWQVTADDGDVVTGTYTFGIGSGASPGGAQSSGGGDTFSGTLLLTSLLRWLLFLALSGSIGGLAGRFLVRRLVRTANEVGARTLPPQRRLPVATCCLLGAGAAVLLAAHAADGSSLLDGIGRLVDRREWRAAGVQLPLLEVALFTFSALLTATRQKVARRSGELIVAATSLLLAGVAVSEGFRGHLREQAGPFGALLIGVHLFTAAAWTGALVVVLGTAGRWRAAGRSQAGWQLVRAYASAALVAYLLVAATGTTSAVLLLPDVSDLHRTAYGRVLVVKLVLFAVVTVLALRSRARLAADTDEFGRSGGSRWEPRIMVITLAATAVLVSVTPPRQLARSALAFPPPAPSGPVVEVGTLAGQLTVGASASTGQLRVQVSNPSSDDASHEIFTVRARLLDQSGGKSIALPLRPCGQGCFAAPAQLHAPGGKLLLTVASNGWTGGRTSLDLPWPPVAAAGELDRALELLQATARVTLTEQVTSDTSRTAPIAVTLHDSGHQLLTTEPYGDGSGVQPVHLTPVGGLRRIGFAVASTYFVELTLDTQGRIVAERLVSPNHLINRTLAYPQPTLRR